MLSRTWTSSTGPSPEAPASALGPSSSELNELLEPAGHDASADGDGLKEQVKAAMNRLERDLMTNVYRWTGHFPERTRTLVRHLARRAEELGQVYAADREAQAIIGVTTLVTALAMNHVYGRNYLP